MIKGTKFNTILILLFALTGIYPVTLYSYHIISKQSGCLLSILDKCTYLCAEMICCAARRKNWSTSIWSLCNEYWLPEWKESGMAFSDSPHTFTLQLRKSDQWSRTYCTTCLKYFFLDKYSTCIWELVKI